jgi:hypothetical protein
MSADRFDVDLCLRELEEEDKRNILAVQRAMREQRAFRPDWPLIGVWAVLVAFIGLLYGFAVAWLYPLIHRLLVRMGL